MIYAVMKCDRHLRAFKRSREQEGRVVYLVQRLCQARFVPSQENALGYCLCSKPNPPPAVAPAAVMNQPFLGKLLEAAFKGMLGNSCFSCNPAQTGDSAGDIRETKVEDSLIFGEQNGRPRCLPISETIR